MSFRHSDWGRSRTFTGHLNRVLLYPLSYPTDDRGSSGLESGPLRLRRRDRPRPFSYSSNSLSSGVVSAAMGANSCSGVARLSSRSPSATFWMFPSDHETPLLPSVS